ncbi:integral peroxisomal membrane peroxin-domain-containing protein [Multifurca ochricompacta]|uniref:Integral peroxisomal membrane peroxin-domain-containing protein n=1 Tax=Multifurca ochricompacta TaxID=376703 RepID=A0AAD4M8V0_9AGAM|nr:integral peroxisomal membrane peroxin-domain-containing protein [Multifurca ochricompacta]
MHHRTVSQPPLSPTPTHTQDQEQPDKSDTDEQPADVDALAGAPTLIDFLHTIPAPLVALLIRLAPLVSSLRHVAQILSWQASWVDSSLLLAAWWALVLFADSAFRYFLPVIIASAIVCFRRRQPPKHISQPITEMSIQAATRDLAALLVLLPPFPAIPPSLSSSVFPTTALFRACAIASIPYLVLTYLVPVRVLVGLLGTIILTYRAPFAHLLRAALWRSSFFRWALYRSWAELSGMATPASISSQYTNAAAVAQSAKTTITAQLRFSFTVYENQRWWMGLDWTAALLPGERPSWCSASQAPLPPPAAFALPAPTTVFLPIDGKSDTREQRTATWVWAEPEWRVIVRRDGESPAEIGGVENTEETDADGWVYGDNKWESHSGKGGIGKYTRYRCWTRIAVLTETTERVGPGPTGVLREDGDLHPLDTFAGGQAKEASAEKENDKKESSSGSGHSSSPNERRKSIVLGVVGNALRQRLQAAVSGSH